MKICKAIDADIGEICVLADSFKKENISPDLLASKGFLQGNIDRSLFEKSISTTGLFIAKHEDRIIGFVATFPAKELQTGPPAEAVSTVFRRKVCNSIDDVFLYGPIAVLESFQRKRITSTLLKEVALSMDNVYKWGVAFVDLQNLNSLTIHKHLGFSEADRFSYNEDTFVAVYFTPKKILMRKSL